MAAILQPRWRLVVADDSLRCGYSLHGSCIYLNAITLAEIEYSVASQQWYGLTCFIVVHLTSVWDMVGDCLYRGYYSGGEATLGTSNLGLPIPHTELGLIRELWLYWRL